MGEYSASSLREKMKAKARAMAGGEDATEVGASTFKPAEKLNADVKTGMRPISRRAFKDGGGVDGDAPKMRADRKSRACGGGIADEMANTNQKNANESREGKKHVGGMASGGSTQYSKTAVDKEIAKDKRIKPREAKVINALLKGRQKSDEPEMNKGGRTGKATGGTLDDVGHQDARMERYSNKAVADAAERGLDSDIAAKNVLFQKSYEEHSRNQGDMTRRKHGGKTEAKHDKGCDCKDCRPGRKAGGRTNINIIVQPHEKAALAPGGVPVPPPVGAAPPMPMPPRPPMAPPSAMPPGAPSTPPGMTHGMPPGLGAALQAAAGPRPPMPGQMPPQMMGRATGGKVEMTAGAGSGKGRLEKIKKYGDNA